MQQALGPCAGHHPPRTRPSKCAARSAGYVVFCPRAVLLLLASCRRPVPSCWGAGDGQTAPCEFRLSPGFAMGLKIQVTPSRGMELTAACFRSFGNPRGRPWPPKASGVMCRPLGCLVGVWCGHGVLWWPTGRGLGRVLLLCRGPAVASLGPLWSPWGNPRPLQWPPDPQGPWQRPPVGWGWYGAVCRACECRNAHSKWAPTALCFLLFSCGH